MESLSLSDINLLLKKIDEIDLQCSLIKKLCSTSENSGKLIYVIVGKVCELISEEINKNRINTIIPSSAKIFPFFGSNNLTEFRLDMIILEYMNYKPFLSELERETSSIKYCLDGHLDDDKDLGYTPKTIINSGGWTMSCSDSRRNTKERLMRLKNSRLIPDIKKCYHLYGDNILNGFSKTWINY